MKLSGKFKDLLLHILLPWGHNVYALFPQGCMLSSVIFQGHMMKIFYDFEDVIVYIDNIILFTKDTFQHHVKRLSQVLERIKSQNLHIHVKETFIVSQEVDFLGYTLSPKGIKSLYKKLLKFLLLQCQKIENSSEASLVVLTCTDNSGITNHISFPPLAAITSGKTKWKWGPE
jgi:Reverse transcriptase (RNA-dependent DNA polymerase)